MPHTYTVSSSVFSFEEVFYHPYECRLFSHKINMVGKPIQWNLLTSANLRRSVSQCSHITHYHYGCMEVTQHWQAYNQKGDNPKWSNMLLIVNFLWKQNLWKPTTKDVHDYLNAECCISPAVHQTKKLTRQRWCLGHCYQEIMVKINSSSFSLTQWSLFIFCCIDNNLMLNRCFLTKKAFLLDLWKYR